MIFGKNNNEKAEIEFTKIQKKAEKICKERDKIKSNYNKWFETFVWFPVKLESGERVWLQKVWYHLDIRKIHDSNVMCAKWDEKYTFSLESNKKFYHLTRHDLVPLYYVK